MTDYIIRPITIEDALDAAEIWTSVFGDDERLVFEFFRFFDYQEGFGACAEYQGKVVAAAYCPEGMAYVEADGTVHPGAYLYAVATLPEHRGKGLAKAICQALRNTAWAKGREYIFTRPSEPGLYPWYEDAIGAIPAMGCRVLEVEAVPTDIPPYMQLDAWQYLELRTKYLEGLPHVHMDIDWLQFESNIHGFSGGGYFAVGDFVLDCYQDETTAYISEILPLPTPAQAEAVCQGFMAIGGAQKCICTIHGEGQYVSAASNQCDVPKSNPWFGPCFG